MPKRLKTEYIVVHCSANGPDSQIGAKEIDAQHRKQGWAKIGYHKVIKRDGIIEQGREDDEVGAHAHGYNAVSFGICLIGGITKTGKPENNFSIAQFESLAKLLEEYSAKYPDSKILGHRDLPKVQKSCPCFDVKSWWESYNKH